MRPALLIACLLLAGCGSEAATKTVTVPAPTSTAAAAKKYTAYDVGVRHDVEVEIRQQLHELAKNNDGDELSRIAHCAADTARTFTCTSILRLKYAGGFCGKVSAKQRGTVDPVSGSTDWATTSSSNPDLEPC